MDTSCVYSCQHPVWGGAGACVTTNDVIGLGESVDRDQVCLCEDGFVSRDSYGAPSCVRQRAQLFVYMTAAAIQFAGTLFLAWHATQHFKLPPQARTSRRAKIRLRLSISTSVTSAWFAVLSSIGVIRTWTGYLLNSKVILVLLVLSSPVGSPACSLAIDLWIDSLPKVLAAGSLEARLKKLAEKKEVFFRGGLAGAVFLAVVHGTILTFLDIKTAKTVNDIMVSGIVLSTGICIVLLGVRISGVISRAEAQARRESRDFYIKARKTLWRQVAALSGACVLFLIVIGANMLLRPARWTPVFQVVSCITVGTSAFVMAVHFSRPHLSSVRALPTSSAAAYIHSAPGSGVPIQKDNHQRKCFTEPC